MQIKKRILWLDYTKAICITFVVLGHMPLESRYLNLIYSFHIPLFFFLSGFLEKERNIGAQIHHGIKTLLIPYVLLYIICYLFWFPFLFLQNPDRYGSLNVSNALIKPFVGMLLGEGNYTSFSTMVCLALWFLIALFVVKVIHAVLLKISKGSIWFYLLTVSLMSSIAFVMKEIRIDLYFSLDSALLSLPFFAIGHICAKCSLLSSLSSEKTSSRIIMCLFGLTFFLVLVYAVPKNGRVDIDLNIFGQNIGLFYLIGFCGICAMILLSQWYVFKWSIITTISKGTIIILAFHGWVTKVILKVLGLGHVYVNKGVFIDPLTAINVSICTVLLMVPLIKIVQEFFPILIGGRK